MDRPILSSDKARNSWGNTVRLALPEKEVEVHNHTAPVVVVADYEHFEKLKLKAELYDCSSIDEELDLLVRRWGEKLSREAEADGGYMSEEEFLAWSAELRGPEFVAAALEGESANAVVG